MVGGGGGHSCNKVTIVNFDSTNHENISKAKSPTSKDVFRLKEFTLYYLSQPIYFTSLVRSIGQRCHA